MKELTQKNAKEYALEKFNQMPELSFKWNVFHSGGIIEILKIITLNKDVNINKLFALAWLHDIGKIKSEKNHAKLSLEILKKDFMLDDVGIDCILNHGSSGNPKTKEGKIFRYADGLSLFTNNVINFKFYAEAKEGLTFEKIHEDIKNSYEKYRLLYSDSKEIVELLELLFWNRSNKFFNNC